jgi:deoxyribodipyrimidine photolyase
VGSSSLNVRDAEGKYVDRFVPELSKLPPRHKYAPWLCPKSDLTKAGVKLGETYPRPIVDHKTQSKANIERFKQAQRAAKEASTSKKRKGPPLVKAKK